MSMHDGHGFAGVLSLQPGHGSNQPAEPIRMLTKVQKCRSSVILRKLFEKRGLKLISFRRSKTDSERCVLTYRTDAGTTYMKTIDVPLSRLEELVVAIALVEMGEADGLVDWLIS